MTEFDTRGLSVRALNALKRLGVDDWELLSLVDLSGKTHLRNVGAATWQELHAFRDRHGVNARRLVTREYAATQGSSDSYGKREGLSDDEITAACVGGGRVVSVDWQNGEVIGVLVERVKA